MVLKIPSARLPAVENFRSKKMFINRPKAERKIKHLWNKNKNKNSLSSKYIEIHWKLLFSAH